MVLNLWKWILSQSYFETGSMDFFVQSTGLMLLAGICAVDATTVYFEIFEVHWELHEALERRFIFQELWVCCLCASWSYFFLSCPQNSTKITSKSCDPTFVSEENITYKNPYSSFWSKTTFWWITPLLWKGFFKPLEMSDLGNLSETDSSRHHYDQFLYIYQSFMVRKRLFLQLSFTRWNSPKYLHFLMNVLCFLFFGHSNQIFYEVKKH